MSEITLSVIIPVTRMSGKLTNLKKTFLECSEKDIEFVVVHDEQDVGTQSELEDLISIFPDLRIRLYRATLNSPGLARNYGITKSTGSWFCFSDSDDIPYSSNLVETVKNADKLNADVGIGNLLILSKDQELLVESKYLEHINRNSLAAFVQNPGFTRFVFRSKEFKSVEFPKIRMAEDQVYLARSKFLDHKIYVSNLLLYEYHVDVLGQATKNPKSLNELSESLPLIYNLIPLSSSKTTKLLRMLVFRISLTCLARRIKINRALKYMSLVTVFSPLNSFFVLMSFVRLKIEDK